MMLCTIGSFATAQEVAFAFAGPNPHWSLMEDESLFDDYAYVRAAADRYHARLRDGPVLRLHGVAGVFATHE